MSEVRFEAEADGRLWVSASVWVMESFHPGGRTRVTIGHPTYRWKTKEGEWSKSTRVARDGMPVAAQEAALAAYGRHLARVVERAQSDLAMFRAWDETREEADATMY